MSSATRSLKRRDIQHRRAPRKGGTPGAMGAVSRMLPGDSLIIRVPVGPQKVRDRLARTWPDLIFTVANDCQILVRAPIVMENRAEADEFFSSQAFAERAFKRGYGREFDYDDGTDDA